jgi:Transposase DDE domain
MAMVLTVFQFGTIVLDQLAKAAHKINPKINVSGQAFKERFNAHAVAFLKAMFAEALKTTAPASDQVVPLLEVFSAVYLLDSSTVVLPESLQGAYQGCGGAGAKAAAKLFLLLNWLTGGYETLRITAGRKADQNMGEEFLTGRKAGALWLFDLGFFKAAFLAQIAKASSFFLCRLPATQQTFWARNAAGELERCDLDLLLRCSRRELYEIEVVFGPKQEVVARLIIAPVPQEVAAKRRRKIREAARTQGRTVTQRRLRRCDWTLILTNASEQQLPTSTALEVYCVRWQVELAFKLFKSDAKLEQTLATEKHRAECEFHAKLIALLLFNRMSGLVEEFAGEKISPAKLWRRMRGDIQDWLCVLGQGAATAASQLLKFLARYAKTSSGKKYRSTIQRLKRAGKEARQVKLADPLSYLREKKRLATKRGETFTAYLSNCKVTLNPERLGCQRTVSSP